jgi:hypothetical protein
VVRGCCWAELEWAAGAPLGLFASFSLFFPESASSFLFLAAFFLGENKKEV